MSKLVSYRKTFQVGKGPNLRDMLFELLNSDFEKYLLHMQGQSITITIEPAVNKSEKEHMYAYYQKVVLGVAREFFTDMNGEPTDKVKADQQLKDILSREISYDSESDKANIVIKNKRDMSKEELRQFVYNAIVFLEDNGYKVPESSDYKNDFTTGLPGFKTIK